MTTSDRDEVTVSPTSTDAFWHWGPLRLHLCLSREWNDWSLGLLLWSDHGYMWGFTVYLLWAAAVLEWERR